MNILVNKLFSYTTITIAVTMFTVIFNGAVLAQDGQAVKDLDALCSQADYKDSSLCIGWSDDSDNPALETITVIINALAFFGGVLAVIYVMWGGIKYLKSAGAPDKAASGRQTIIYALLGVVVIAVSRSLILFVLGRLL